MENARTFIKGGFAGDVQPKDLFPNVYGYTLGKTGVGWHIRTDYVGYEARYLKEGGSLDFYEFSISKSGEINWRSMVKVWDYFFEKEIQGLNVEISKTPVILIMPPKVELSVKELTQEFFYERYKIPSLAILDSSLCSLTCSGRSTGCIVSIRSNGYYIVPIIKDQIIKEAVIYIPLGGDDITNNLMKLLQKNNSDILIDPPSDFNDINNLKERCCYVAIDPHKEVKLYDRNPRMKKEELTERCGLIKVGKERILAPEILFDPKRFSCNLPSLDRSIQKGIEKCPKKEKNELLKNIILAGGSSFFDRLKERLYCILNNRFKQETIKIIAPPERRYSAWIGGSIIGSQRKSEDIFMSRDKYHTLYPERRDVSSNKYPAYKG